MVDLSEVIEILTLIFVVASVLLMVLDRFSHPALPAYILTGLLISRFVPEQELILLSEIGIAFLIFIFGVKLEPSRLKSVAKESQFTTTVEILLVGTLAFLSGILIQMTLIEALYFSVFAALSSSLVGLNLIEDEIEIDLIHGRLAESIQLVQDIVALAALITFTALIAGGNIVQDIFYATLILTVALIIRRYVFDYIASLIDESRELLMITSVAILASFIGISEAANLSIVIGSFAAGISVAKFPHNIEIIDTTGSVKDFFSAIFFVSLGALVTVQSGRTILIAGILIFLTAVVKPGITVLSLIAQGFDDRTSHLTGFSLDQISEFSLILGITGHLAGVISPELFNGLILAATVTMITSAYTSRHEEFLYQWIRKFNFIPSRRKIRGSENLAELEDHVILAGYDTQGRTIAESLKSEGQDFVVIENDPEKVEDLREKGEEYVYGDVMDEEPWEKSEVSDARLIFSTIPIQKVSHHILDLDTDADIILRADKVNKASELLNEGAIYVNVPEVVSSEMLVDHIEGVIENKNYREELRRKSLLEIRRYLTSEEG